MYFALSFIAFRQWSHHKLRLALTLAGIVLGVAVFFSARTASTSVRASLKSTVERIAGKATLQVTAGESGFPEQVLQAVRATPGILFAEPVIETLARTGFEGEGDLLVIGFDSTGDRKLREYQFDEAQSEIGDTMSLLASPYSIVVSREFADKHGLKLEDKISLHTPSGLKEFTVRGFFKPAGIGSALGGQVAVMDIFSAQLVFKRGKNFDRIDVVTDPNLPVETVQQQIRERLPAGLHVTRPSLREPDMDNWVGAMHLGQEVMSYLALVVGIFLIFNSFSIAVNQRWKEIGILRALGVEGRTIQAMFLGEALALGIIGSALGVAAGFYLASLVSRVMTSVAASAYGQASGAVPQVFRWDFALASFAIGIGASLLAAWLPARAASRINPALSLHNIETRQREHLLGWPRITAGVILIAAGLALIRFADLQVGVMYQFSFVVIILLGFICLLPKLIEWAARAMRPLMDRAFGPEGVLAVDTMIATPRRTSATVGAVMLGLSFVFSNGAAIQSHYDAVLRSIDRAIDADLIVTASAQLRSLTYRFDETFGTQVAGIAGVASAERKRFTFVNFRDDSVALVATDTGVWLGRVGNVLESGDYASARQAVPRGEGVIIAENFARRWNVALGDRVRIDAPAGTLDLPVMGIIEDYHSDKGTIFIERSLYKKYWNDSSADYLLVKLRPDADVSSVRNEIQKAGAGQQQAFIYSNDEYKKWITGLIDRFFILYDSQIVIAILVAAIGIINTLTISVSDRKREFGVIRAVGGFRWQIGKMVLLEAVAIILVGILVGTISSLFNTYFLVRTASNIIAGVSLPFRFPLQLILTSLPVALVVAMLAAWVPARRAVKLQVIAALGAE